MSHPSEPFVAFQIDPVHHRSLSFDEVSAWSSADGPIWVHLDRTTDQAKEWLTERAGLDEHVAESLLARATRPRIEAANDGFMLTLRGVNLNEGADPSDMISLRIWVDPTRLISLERERLRSIGLVLQSVRDGEEPHTIGELLAEILERLTEKVGTVIDGINDQLDELEDLVIGPGDSVDRSALLTMRQQVIKMHRYIKPQADVIQSLRQQKPGMLDAHDLRVLTETHNRITRYVEDLDAAKGRTILIQDELSNQYSERLNNRMYAVTMVATILLPMSIFTGLLGINVGGIPAAQSPYGFLGACVILLLMGLAGYWIVRKSKWL